MTIELTYDEMQLLTLALGIAAGVAAKDRDERLGHAVLKLANTVHKDDPHWTPYDVPPEGVK